MDRPRFAAIGECMIELRHRGESRIDLAFGGDTLNTAAYLSRLVGDRGIAVDYASAVGDDPYSDAMLAFWRAEGVGTDLAARLRGRLPGLYAIRTDAKGERSFYYWRREAAARSMFDGAAGQRLADRLAGYDWLYLSGISLSILDDAGRATLCAALDRARARGARIAFDSNYRARGWDNAAAARKVFEAVMPRIDIALPSLDDERAVFGDADAAACARRLRAAGIGEVAVKNGGGPVLLSNAGGEVALPAESVSNVVDTTAAGDAFNAGYLAARMLGLDPERAARTGSALSAVVIQHPGAVIPRAAMPSGLLPES